MKTAGLTRDEYLRKIVSQAKHVAHNAFVRGYERMAMDCPFADTLDQQFEALAREAGLSVKILHTKRHDLIWVDAKEVM